jgi:hypothetical protein
LEQVNLAENLARYIFQRNHFSSQNHTVRYAAFMPPPSNHLSVFRISGLAEHEIWKVGHEVGEKSARSLLGRADIKALSVIEAGLNIDADDIPPRHADIIGWPEEDSAIKLKAIELAEKAQLRLKEGG